MQQRRWFLALLPVMVQSLTLLMLSSRFSTLVSRIVTVILGLGGIMGAIGVFILCTTAEQPATGADDRWAEQTSFLLKKFRQDTANDLQLMSGLVQLGDSHKALDYARHAGNRLETEGQILKRCDPRLAVAILTGQAVAVSEGTELRVEVDRVGGQSPACRGLGRSLERVISYTAEACKKAGSGRLHMEVTEKMGRWQIRLACTGPLKEEEMSQLVSSERGMGDFSIRATQEVDRGAVFVFDFPRRIR